MSAAFTLKEEKSLEQSTSNLRHCNTKLASDHLVSSNSAKERILRLGENEDSVHVIGSPELDIHSQHSGVSLKQVRKKGIAFLKKTMVFLHFSSSNI